MAAATAAATATRSDKAGDTAASDEAPAQAPFVSQVLPAQAMRTDLDILKLLEVPSVARAVWCRQSISGDMRESCERVYLPIQRRSEMLATVRH